MRTGLLYWELGRFLAIWGEKTGFSNCAVQEQSGGLKPTPAFARETVWFPSFTPVTVLSAPPERQGRWVARDGAQKGICTQMQARLFVHGNGGQRRDGINWPRIGTGFAGTAGENVRSMCVFVLEGNATKSSLHLSGCNC